MESLYLIVPLGVALSLLAFLFFEKKAIQSKRQSTLKGDDEQTIVDLNENLKRYNTLNNVSYFFISSFVISLILAIVGYSPEYGLIEALLYIFLTTFIGSSIIFILKLNKSLLTQVFAAFLYGVPHIAASAFAFLTRYLFS
ncbi:MAG: hypothetical protein U9N30_02635 [Campylobacterota bacterium]|nr:hypothetical protein [Campylobacterota bacterium]